MKALFLYSNMAGITDWAPTLDQFKRNTGAVWGCRCHHGGYSAPVGYQKGADELANTPVNKTLGMRQFIQALAP